MRAKYLHDYYSTHLQSSYLLDEIIGEPLGWEDLDRTEDVGVFMLTTVCRFLEGVTEVLDE